MAALRTLVMTLPPFDGGVPAKTRWLCDELRARGHDVTVGYYATFGADSDVNAPLWTVAAGRRPQSRAGTCFDGFRSVAVGSWLPELEFTYYMPSSRWSDLIVSHDRHIAIGGQTLISYPLAAAGVPHLVWCASSVDGDRGDRVRAMPWPRRALDHLLIAPRLRSMERRIISGNGKMFGVSRYTARTLGGRAEGGLIGYLPIPVDVAGLTPPSTPPRPGLIGFAGRLNDPRKNFTALLAAVTSARGRGLDIRLMAVGAAPNAAVLEAVRKHGLERCVDFPGEVDRTRLARFYRELDLFVIPSHQEGLCIAGIEAMACGVPVVSTRCGGPEDYVRPGQTGMLVGSTSEELAEAIVALAGDRGLRARLSQGARGVAEAEYAPAVFREKLAAAWRAIWGESL
ncbi:MAG: glycosyltransferase family 4 protein [Alphaproteobacteria bacterium]|nr:glycosyltransferase family 4 protein [Alphaproteobacteria bacterium]